jgi:hypothetical protein
MDGLHIFELVKLPALAPLGKAARGVDVGTPRVVVADLRREKLDEALLSLGRRREKRR